MRRICLYIVSLGIIAIFLGCAATTQQTTSTGERSTQAQAQAKTEVSKPAAEKMPKAAAAQSTIQNDPSTGEISGTCTLTILFLPSLGRSFDRAMFGLKNVANILNHKTKVSVDPRLGIASVAPNMLYSLKAPFLLVKPSRELSNAQTKQALADYAQRGGFILVDGIWQGELVPNSARSPITPDHQILLYPNMIGNLPGQLRRMELVQSGGRVIGVITHGELTPQWARATSSMAASTVQVKLGINLIIYALTQSKLCNNSNFDIYKDPNSREYRRKHPRKVELSPEI
ncbi:DUF4159 domain-containing protein [Candidatus Poribacteria bacterium]|nr:DUF4159 domain-containing protein [Candidatus Poribacteria bacterium]